jgi:hypothetical protein
MSLPVGTKLKLREPLPDNDDGTPNAWNTVCVTGHFDSGPDGGGIEVVLTPQDGFAAPVKAAADTLHRTGYDIVSEADEADAWQNDPSDPAPVMPAGLFEAETKATRR